MNYDLLLHVDAYDQDVLDVALGNIANYLDALPGETPNVALVANAGAVKLFTRANTGLPPVLAKLREKGVAFRLCNNALRKFSIPASDLLDGCEVVPAGVVELVRLQREGYAYVKP